MNEVEPIRSTKHIEKIKTLLSERSARDFALFVVGINTGLRISDLLSLRIRDVLERGGVAERITLRERKTGKAASIPLSASARDAVRRCIAERRSPDPDDPLFRSRRGGPLSRFQAHRIISGAAKAAGVKGNIGTHSLRKTFGYHAYKAGADLALIQKLLRHSSPDITLRYIGITQDALDNVVLTLEF